MRKNVLQLSIPNSQTHKRWLRYSFEAHPPTHARTLEGIRFFFVMLLGLGFGHNMYLCIRSNSKGLIERYKTCAGYIRVDTD